MTDHHFPKFHVRPANGFVNDPNGPVYVDKRLHLYYQYNPSTAQRSPVMWGHASSQDLVNWVHHRAAMTPCPTGLDRDGVWSGSTVKVGLDVVAFYSGFRRTSQYQSVLTARSRDGGFSFAEGELAVSDPSPGEGIVSFRDPFVWREGDSWRMVVGAGDEHDTACVRLYGSSDLQDWTYEGPLVSQNDCQGTPWTAGAMWECPQVIGFGSAISVLVSPWSATEGISNVLAISGDYTGGRLRNPTFSLYDAGPNFYAACALRESEIGPIVWGWATEARTKDWTEDVDWSGMVSLPRAVRLEADGTLASAPVPAMCQLRQHAISPRKADGPGAGTSYFDDLPAQVEVLASFAACSERTESRVRLRFSPAEYLDLSIDWRSSVITVVRDHASTDERAHKGAFPFSDPCAVVDRELTVRLFLDGSIIEVFTNSGKCSTTRIYPVAPPPWSLEVTGLASDDRVEVWPLRGTLPHVP